MVLSTLFGKKKHPDKNRGKKVLFDDESSSESAAPSSSGASNGNAISAGVIYPDSARDLAKETARKIDLIESEMSREMAPGRGNVAAPTQSAANTSQAGINNSSNPAGLTNVPPVPKATFMGMGTTTPSVGQSTDILLGDSMLSNAIELSDSINNPAIEEAAILFAYGQSASAADVLSDSLRPGQSNESNLQAWLMLLELYQISADKLRFESLAIDYALRFESSAPTWADRVNKPIETAVDEPSMPSMQALVVFEGCLDSSIVPQLDRLKRLTPKHHTLYVDFSGIDSVEPAGAELLLRMLGAFSKSNHALVVQGADALFELLLAKTGNSALPKSKSLWTLFLDLLRLLDRQAEFEEKSMEYCMAFEVSPPPWEAYSANIQVDHVAPMRDLTTIPATETELPPDTIALSGELLGKAENDLALLTNFASELTQVNVDCSKLSRVDFTAAGALLNWAVSQQAANKTIEFRKVSHLVGALFVVMGIHEVAQIERR